MKESLMEIDAATSQIVVFHDIIKTLINCCEKMITDFHRKVITSLYKDVDGFNQTFSNVESVAYLHELFECQILEAVPAHLPFLIF